MQLFSEIPVDKPDFSIEYKNKIFCLGSCFVHEIGQKLQQAKFETLINPFGTQFHPIAMENVFSRIFSRTSFTENEIYAFNGLFFSWEHSSHFSANNLEKALENINATVEVGNEFLSSTDLFIFTLGSAWAYQLRDGNFFVSNCHKVPQSRFSKELLSYNELYNSCKNMILMAKDVRPQARIIFTLSPVRHARDGFFENNVSKGLLHQVLYQILIEFEDVMYFPSYEIVMDELRDYRYYADDLVHLNQLGVNYIWEKFRLNYFTEQTQKIMVEVSKIKAALNHRSLNPGRTEHKSFLYNTLKTAEKLSLQLPKNALKTEIEEIKFQLHAY
ncbi:MAG: GSCFA domain-containing protein [Flavobacteriaceae bacterium]|nr:GSCFA domain-containing protein [Flavobacteriaceae bacterium]